jgi:hypothetical protein
MADHPKVAKPISSIGAEITPADSIQPGLRPVCDNATVIKQSVVGHV